MVEPFSQVGHKATAAATGMGLGLAISRSLVERMGGKLRVESKPGRGSWFWFEVALPGATAAIPAAANTACRIVGDEGERRRVLIVDDNAANRAVMVDMLAPLGFEMAEAADGPAALSAAERFQPHLVLMDLRLPGGYDGLEATRRLRRTERGPAMKIVAVSASAYDLDRRECFVAGCDEFLAMPFREEELWAAIERTLGLVWHHAETEETRSPFAQGVLDLAARFKMMAIRQFVARYTNLENAEPTNVEIRKVGKEGS